VCPVGWRRKVAASVMLIGVVAISATIVVVVLYMPS